LDATTEPGTAVAVDGGVVVNGPEGDLLDWDAVDWRQVEEDVRRLRQRIFTASRAGDLKKVRNLQKLTAPRGALLYPRLSREEFEGRFLGLMPYLEPKGKGNHSMAEN
jgi:N-terminal domain of reverse transcriptase